VSVSLYGPSKDPVTVRTKTISNNGFNPIWDEVHNVMVVLRDGHDHFVQTFEFIVKKPELCQLYLRVMDTDNDADDFIAYSSTPVECLTQGYRHFQLFDNNGKRDGDFQFASVFCRIVLEEQ
jgi:phosphatidylinositol phospholipase C, delta